LAIDGSVERFDDVLMTAHCAPVDILVRTSGEIRLSDFLLWQVCIIYIDANKTTVLGQMPDLFPRSDVARNFILALSLPLVVFSHNADAIKMMINIELLTKSHSVVIYLRLRG
jgi:hypothetical protein